jgi:hypothetical protein
VNCWINTTVTLNDAWGLGAEDILQTPLGKLAEFSLRPRYLRDAQGNRQLAHFTVDFPSGFLPDGWQGATFTPMGTQPVAGVYDLPPWDPSTSATYRKVIEAATSLGDSRTLRLEGVIPYLGANGGVGYDTVRLFYAFNAVKGSKIPHLVVIKTATLIEIPGTVQARQDGSGNGPPN